MYAIQQTMMRCVVRVLLPVVSNTNHASCVQPRLLQSAIGVIRKPKYYFALLMLVKWCQFCKVAYFFETTANLSILNVR